MRELTDPVWIKVKGLLFLFLGLLSGILLLAGNPTLEAGLLLAITV